MPEKYQSYMGLLKPVLSYMDTEKHSYTELNTEIDLDLGGFAFDSGIYVNKKTGEPMLTGGSRKDALWQDSKDFWFD